MNDSERKDLLNKLFKVRIAVVEVGTAETNEAAWLLHLATNPGNFGVSVRIFHRHQPGREGQGGAIKAPEKIIQSC